MNTTKRPLSDIDTYIFIDTSNIRSSCFTTLGFWIDFKKLYHYFQQKYPNLKAVYYYEGIANDDNSKIKEFNKLRKIGYTVKSLARKSYLNPAIYKDVKCKKCGNIQRTQIQKKSVSLKSNVDVFLSADLLNLVYTAKKKTHIILVSCDGDYAEMIKVALNANPKIYISVLGTPVVKNRTNTFSMRLQELRKNNLPRFLIRNIDNIRPKISQTSNKK